jgi:hypothetical protein
VGCKSFLSFKWETKFQPRYNYYFYYGDMCGQVFKILYWNDEGLIQSVSQIKYDINCPVNITLFVTRVFSFIDQIIPKLSAACYMVRQMYYICNNDTLRSIYFAYFHSIASYGIILGENSPYSKKIFTIQKRIVSIMVGAHPRTSCRRLFKKN